MMNHGGSGLKNSKHDDDDGDDDDGNICPCLLHTVHFPCLLFYDIFVEGVCGGEFIIPGVILWVEFWRWCLDKGEEFRTVCEYRHRFHIMAPQHQSHHRTVSGGGDETSGNPKPRSRSCEACHRWVQPELGVQLWYVSVIEYALRQVSLMNALSLNIMLIIVCLSLIEIV